MAQRALALNQDGIWLLGLRRSHDGALQFSTTELGWHCIHGNTIFCPLHQSSLTGADKHCLDALCVQRTGQNRRCCAFANRAIRTKHGNAYRVDIFNAPVKKAHVFALFGFADISDCHIVF